MTEGTPCDYKVGDGFRIVVSYVTYYSHFAGFKGILIC